MTDHLLVQNNWFPLVREDIDAIKDLMTSLGINKLGPLTLKQYINLLKQDSDYIRIARNNVEVEAEPSSHAQTPAHSPTQIANITATLYPYQEDGYHWLRLITDEDMGGILADEMGLGKTIQVIALMGDEKSQGRRPTLVIAPATLLENWRRELAKFAPTLTCLVHRGSGRTGFPSTLAKYDITITSYDTAVGDLSMLQMIHWNIVVLDEAQAIKNPLAIRTREIKKIPRRIAIAVTGTPVENHLTDLWSIMDFVCPGLLGEQRGFESRFSDDVTGAHTLEPLTSPFILRRRIKDVAKDLPPRLEIPQPIPLDDLAAARYDELRNEILTEKGSMGYALGLLTRLRMFCTHPFLLSHEDNDPALYSTKYQRLLEIIDEIIAQREKLLIFTSYTEMIAILIKDLPARLGVYVDFIDGEVKVEERQPRVDRFSSLRESAILILNPRAAGTGLNISSANHVVHYNLEWNPAVEDQASARAYRRGQKQPVTIHRLFHANTVEEIIDDRLEQKRRKIESAVVGHEGKGDDLNYIIRALEISPVVRKD